MASQPEHRVVIDAPPTLPTDGRGVSAAQGAETGPHSTAAVHVAITRTVKAGMEETFQKALREFARESLHFPGTTGVHLISPMPGADGQEFGILRSFESESVRKQFYASELYKAWERAVAPAVVGGPTCRQLHGLEAFFRETGQRPPRWKMAIVTWLGVFPAVLLWSSVLPTPLSALHPVLVGAIVDVFVVVTLTWCLMPWLTRFFAGWLTQTQKVGQRETPTATAAQAL